MTKLDDSVLSKVHKLLDAYTEYCRSRLKLLSLLPRPSSCGDPVSEFSETLVAKLLNAKCAVSPVQKGYDLTRPNSRTVQVESLSTHPELQPASTILVHTRNADGAMRMVEELRRAGRAAEYFPFPLLEERIKRYSRH
jgi:hypothetical protein